MTGPEMEQYARIGAIIAGIVFGGWALSSVIWVWTKKQIYAYGGSALSVVGIILMGLSIYKTVDVSASPDKIGLKLAEVEQLLKQQASTQSELKEKVAQLPASVEQKFGAWAISQKPSQNTASVLFDTKPTDFFLNKNNDFPLKVSAPPIIPRYDLFSCPPGTYCALPRSMTMQQIQDRINTLTDQLGFASRRSDAGERERHIAEISARLGDLYVLDGKHAEARRSYENAAAAIKRLESQ